ncbi:unnamed protein product [Dovyalis caffra]|uniref:Small auxin up regulated protein n=1 Tax=Dovyalis caffra TaxID=77055 RepID=A0AAV1SBU5_9ROSI|nr:unnamed protein product [Dovyalis caffra]
MRKIRGFKIGKRLVRISTWIFRRTRIHPPGYNLLGQSESESTCRSKLKSISKIFNWGRRLTKGAKALCSAKPGSGYVPLGHENEPYCDKPATVPKGHLAVYVGQKDGDFHRVLVPVIYFNHPLFGELLREAEEEYGFNQQGGITIPCRFSEFERVQTRIKAGSCGRKPTWKLRELVNLSVPTKFQQEIKLVVGASATKGRPLGQVVETVQWAKPNLRGPNKYVVVLAVGADKQERRRFQRIKSSKTETTAHEKERGRRRENTQIEKSIHSGGVLFSETSNYLAKKTMIETDPVELLRGAS